MSVFTATQIDDLRDLQRLCQKFGTEAVIIGAMAYQLFVEDTDRMTRDIDLALAINLEGLARLEEALAALGWRQVARCEHRWQTVSRNLDGSPARWAFPTRCKKSDLTEERAHHELGWI